MINRSYVQLDVLKAPFAIEKKHQIVDGPAGMRSGKMLCSSLNPVEPLF